jgi:hypothetical protein
MAGLRNAIADKNLADYIGETKEGWAKGRRDGETEAHDEIPASHTD